MRLKFQKNRFKTVATAICLIFSAILIPGHFFYESGFRFNMTSSLPIGIWKIDKTFTHIERGNYIWFTLPKKIAAFAIERGYLKENKNCPNNTIPMLKQIYGLPGDTYSFFDDVLNINNTVIENTRRKQVDSKNRSMPQIKDGVVLEGQLLVLAHHSNSFDSRYFGTIPAANIIGTAKPIIVWKN